MRADPFVGAAALILAAFSVATLIALGYLGYSRVPLLDAWNHWTVWIQYLRFDHFWAFLFSQHNEHRIPVSRLLYLADLRFSRADSRLLLCCTYVAQTASAVMLYRLTSASLRQSFWDRAFVLGVILTFAFSASQWINFIWTFQVCFIVVFAAAIAAFTALQLGTSARLDNGTVRTGWVAAAIGFGLIATGTMSNGLLIWPLMVLMSFCLRLPRKTVATIAGVGIAAWLAYLYRYQRTSAVTVAGSLARLPLIVTFACAYLGSLVDEPLMAIANAAKLDFQRYRILTSAVTGLVGIAGFTALTVRAVRERLDRRNEITVLHVLAFLICSAGLTAIGRVQFPLKDALTSRYVTPSLLFWAGLLSLALSRRGAFFQSDRGRFIVLGAAVFVGGLVQLPKVAYARDAERYLIEGEYAFINNVYAPEAWSRFYPLNPATMIPVVRYFRAERLASFSPEWVASIGELVVAHFAIASQSACLGAWESVALIPGSYSPAVAVQGWAFDRRFNRVPDRIVFSDTDGRIVGLAPTTRRRPDVEAATPFVGHGRVGWVGYLRAGVPTTLIAYAVLGDGTSVCRVGAAEIPPNYQTAPPASAGQEVSDVDVSVAGMWAREVVPAAPANPWAAATWSSHTVQGRGVLRVGPVVVPSGTAIGLPLITGPATRQVRLSIIERSTRDVLAESTPPRRSSTWDPWKFENPVGAPDVTVDLVVEHVRTGVDDWVAVSLPRRIAAAGNR